MEGSNFMEEFFEQVLMIYLYLKLFILVMTNDHKLLFVSRIFVCAESIAIEADVARVGR